MEIFISIDGVIRNTIQKFDYHYKNEFIDSEFDEDNTFEYGISDKVLNDSLFNYYKFQDKNEFDFFLYMEYPIEIFGHAGLSYPTTFTDLHKIIHENPEHTFTLIGLDELGKARPATLFFLSKNGFLGDNIKFIKTPQIQEMWNKCDVWITDNKSIIDLCPEGKDAIKFNTPYNEYFTNKKEITKLTEITEPWLKSTENTTTLTLTQSQTDVESSQ
jgi:hypothetical protein